MRLVTKLTVAFLGVVLLMIVLHESRRLERARADFELDMDRAHRLVAVSLADTLELVAAREGVAAALPIIARADAGQAGDIAIRWVCAPDEDSTGAHGDAPCASLATNREPLERAVAGARRVTWAPVEVEGRFLGAVEVSEPPEHEDVWVARHRAEAVGLAVMMVAATTALAFVLGIVLVARPTTRLVEKARAVARGDLETPVDVHGWDELGELAREMDAMGHALAAARSAAEREGAARMQATEQLRHADRLATVGRLASGLAHELGTPLNVIGARASLIAEDASTSSASRRSAEVIVESVDHMSELVRQLLVFARKRTLERTRFSLVALAERVVRTLAPVASKRGVEMAVGVTEPLIASADEVLLQQALTHLAVNALQACRYGGHVELRVRRAQLHRPGEPALRPWLVLDVADDGEGMSPEVQARAFEPFFTTKAPGEGTGLGLAVAWGIAADHEGWLSVESTEGIGTVFSLMLPVDTRAAEGPGPSRAMLSP